MRKIINRSASMIFNTAAFIFELALVPIVFLFTKLTELIPDDEEDE